MSEFTVPPTGKYFSAPVTVQGFLAAVAFNLVVFSFVYYFWAEQGPYQWIAGAQYALMESYSKKLTLFILLLFYTPLGLVMIRPIGPSERWARRMAFGPILLALALHFILTFFFLITGGPPAKGTTPEEAVRSATFLPRAVAIDTKYLNPPDTDRSTHIGWQTSHIQTYRESVRGLHYIPLTSEIPIDSKFPVIVASGGFALERMHSQTRLEGIIYKSPLPYFLRRKWEANEAVFCVLISNGRSMRDYWSPFGMLYGVLLASCMVVWLSKRSEAKSIPAA